MRSSSQTSPQTPGNIHGDHAAVRGAVHRHQHLSKQGLLERAFTFAFRGLVYAQIWEDPDVDLEALAITPDCHVLAIASGGCNVLSYLTANPLAITAVDLNTAHIALNHLKVVAATHLPGYDSFYRFFGQASRPENIAAYNTHVRPHLDETSRRYWEGRDLIGRRRISGFTKGFYRRGLLGNFIGLAHLLAKAYGMDPRIILEAKTIEEQQAIFQDRFAPLFDKKFVGWLLDQPASLFGLGIPPAQYEALSSDEHGGIREVVMKRLEKLACDFTLSENYFAWQAFSRGYDQRAHAAVPPYLRRDNYETVVERASRIEIQHLNMVDYMEAMPDVSIDRFVLLDAQDWMTDEQLTRLWTAITRTARPGSRVLFRTAAEPSLLPGRIPDTLLDRWHYAEESRDFIQRDRSAIYGGVHLYILKPV